MKWLKLTTLLTIVALLQGCVAAAVVTAVGGVSVINDRRSVGHQIDDQTIEFNAYTALSNASELKNTTNIHVISVNATVLLIGQATSKEIRDIAVKAVSNVAGIVRIQNQIKIGSPTSILTRTNDTWLTTKVKAALLASKALDATNIKVITENGEVFLMGLVSNAEAQAAIELARNIKGVNRVYNAFEITK